MTIKGPVSRRLRRSSNAITEFQRGLTIGAGIMQEEVDEKAKQLEEAEANGVGWLRIAQEFERAEEGMQATIAQKAKQLEALTKAVPQYMGNAKHAMACDIHMHTQKGAITTRKCICGYDALAALLQESNDE